MSTTTKAVREEGKDKFYTVPSVAQSCLNHIGERYPWTSWDLVVEPGAGNGSFLTRIPVQNRIGIDIAPEHESIVRHDFLTWAPPPGHSNILVVGNPPFGRISSTAIKFFNHAAHWASAIAFIVPRTFRRVSVQNKLARNFHLEFDVDIPMSPCSFQPPIAAKCCFQIWRRTNTLRPTQALPVAHADWDFLPFGPDDENDQPTPPNGADFAILAYGGQCGRIVSSGLSALRPKSWHWIRANIDVDLLRTRFQAIDYSVSQNTARQNSIGRGELVRLYSASYDV
jgi:hypothetical protein